MGNRHLGVVILGLFSPAFPCVHFFMDLLISAMGITPFALSSGVILVLDTFTKTYTRAVSKSEAA